MTGENWDDFHLNRSHKVGGEFKFIIYSRHVEVLIIKRVPYQNNPFRLNI